MGVLRIRLFGTVQVSHDGEARGSKPIHGVQALLAYLVLHRRKTHAREVLSGLFWGEQTDVRARSCLSTALWRLRQVLEPPGVARGTYLLTSGAGEVGFNWQSDHWLDVAAFEDGLQRLFRLKSERLTLDWPSVEGAVAQYTGDLLEGFYEDWALRERERLRMLYLDGLGRLLDHYSESEALEHALDCGRRILALDPLREEIHRAIIRLHLRSGHRALALQQYRTCRDLLDQELGVDPMPETVALHDEIAAAAAQVSGRRTTIPTLRDVLPPLRTAAENLDEARHQLSRAIRLAEFEDDGPRR